MKIPMKIGTSGPIFFAVLLAGCATLGPTEEKIQSLPWQDYDRLVLAYGMVKEGETNLDQLEILGFDLKRVSGSEDWDQITTRNYLLGPGTNFNDLNNLPEGVLPNGAKACLKTAGGCKTRVVDVDMTQKKTAGNYIFKEEILGIEEQRRVTGSKFHAKFFYGTGDRVIYYKSDIPKPFVDDLTKKKEPLGTFKRLFGLGRKIFCPFC